MPAIKRNRVKRDQKYNKKGRYDSKPYARQNYALTRRYRSGTPLKRQAAIGLGFPNQLKITHKYVDTFPISASGGAFNYFSMKANGMYDPQPTVGGHQPLYFDVCSNIYNHFTVIGSRMTAKFAAAGGAITIPFKCCVYLNDDQVVTGTTTINSLIEQQDVVWDQIGPDNMQVTLVKDFSLRREFGHVNLSQDGYRGNSTSDPTELSYFTLGVQSSDVVGDAASIVTIEIEYIAIWTELRDIAQS